MSKNKNSNIKIDIIRYSIVIAILLFTILYVYFFQWWKENLYLIIATLFATYMLLNLWANDVANNVWPAVWAKAITIMWALVIAAIFEAAWAILAWWDVADTIKWWIIDKTMIWTQKELIVIMMSTLLGSAIWTNIATFFKAPISVTNAVVWALIWAWLVAAGPSIVMWWKVWEIWASWIISLLLWWIISVLIYMSIRRNILNTKHKWLSAKKWVPVYIWIIVFVFTIYLLLKWLKPVLGTNEYLSLLITPFNATCISLFLGFLVIIWLRIKFNRHKDSYFEDDKDFVNKLFNIPLIFAICLLCFAHWSNDVANAIWPLAAIYETSQSTDMNIVAKASTPLWMLILGWLWLSTWLAIFWSRLVKSVWKSITKIDQSRAFCISLSTASTVLIASTLWLPVSSTQITLWAIFWIWLFRQYLSWKKWTDKTTINIVMMKWILLSWVITLPISWLIAGLTYFVLIRF